MAMLEIRMDRENQKNLRSSIVREHLKNNNNNNLSLNKTAYDSCIINAQTNRSKWITTDWTTTTKYLNSRKVTSNSLQVNWLNRQNLSFSSNTIDPIGTSQIEIMCNAYVHNCLFDFLSLSLYIYIFVHYFK